jgi:ABC-2 type transport system ATP-binding protein
MTTVQDSAIVRAEALTRTFQVTRKVGRLRRTTDTVHALRDVTLRVRRGEMIGLIGPNGAGKSTLLKIITGVLAPTEGTIEVCGMTPSASRRDLTRRLGVVFGQRSHLWWDLPLRMSFDILREIYEVPREDFEARLQECRKILGLEEFLDQPVRQLSLGQRMRGEVSAALLHGPELLVLDEPTIGLDVVSRLALREHLRQISLNGSIATILTTHDLGEIEQLCERVVVVDHGRVIHDGALEALFHRHGHHREAVVTMAEPVTVLPDLPAEWRARIDDGGKRVTIALPSDSDVRTALHAIGALGAVTDLRITGPAIDDVVARLYTS